MARSVTRRQVAAAIAAVRTAGDEPDRETTATAVRASLRWLAQTNPGKAVEIRVPPYCRSVTSTADDERPGAIGRARPRVRPPAERGRSHADRCSAASPADQDLLRG